MEETGDRGASRCFFKEKCSRGWGAYSRVISANRTAESGTGLAKNIGKMSMNVPKMSLKNVPKKERMKNIINKVKAKEPFTLMTLAKELNVSEKTIDRDIEELKSSAKIRFIPFFAIETCSCSIY